MRALDHYKIPSSAEPSYTGVNRKTDVKFKEESVWADRERGRPAEPVPPLHYLRIISTQMTDLDINCLPLPACIEKYIRYANAGRTSRDKLSELDKHIPLTRSELWFYPRQWSTRWNLVAWQMTPASVFTVKKFGCLLLKRGYGAVGWGPVRGSGANKDKSEELWDNMHFTLWLSLIFLLFSCKLHFLNETRGSHMQTQVKKVTNWHCQ